MSRQVKWGVIGCGIISKLHCEALAMADSVINDYDPLITPREARKAVDLILAIYQSSNENREIKL